MAWQDPKVAPGGLAVVQAFVNTAHRMRGTDELGDVAGGARALAGLGLLAAADRLGDDGLARLVALREALRDLLSARTAGGDPGPAAAALDLVARDVAVAVRIGPDGGPAVVPTPAATPADRAAAGILGAVAGAAADGTWARLKACANDDCRWAFYDAARNRSGRWCDMDVCGARHKMRAYRRRQR